MCGAVYVARLKRYFLKHCKTRVESWVHLVDSQMFLRAIQRENYGYQTYLDNRIGEIHGNTNSGVVVDCPVWYITNKITLPSINRPLKYHQ